MAFADRHRRQLNAVGDVADGMDAWYIGGVVCINDHRPISIKRDARGLQPQILGFRHASDGKKQQIGFNIIAIAAFDQQ